MRRIAGSRYAIVLLIAVLVAVLPFVLPSLFYVRIAALVFIFALAVLGLNLLMGFAGQVSLGHAGFFGIGAYAVAVGPTHLGIPSWVALPVGAALAGLIAFAIGRPTTNASSPASAAPSISAAHDGMAKCVGPTATA